MSDEAPRGVLQVKADVVTEPFSPAELARDIVQVERRLDREYEQLRNTMSDGFARAEASLLRLEESIAQLAFVSPDLFRVDQGRQDRQMEELKEDMTSMRAHFVGGLLMVLVAAVLAGVLMP